MLGTPRLVSHVSACRGDAHRGGVRRSYGAVRERALGHPARLFGVSSSSIPSVQGLRSEPARLRPQGGVARVRGASALVCRRGGLRRRTDGLPFRLRDLRRSLRGARNQGEGRGAVSQVRGQARLRVPMLSDHGDDLQARQVHGRPFAMFAQTDVVVIAASPGRQRTALLPASRRVHRAAIVSSHSVPTRVRMGRRHRRSARARAAILTAGGRLRRLASWVEVASWISAFGVL